MPGRRWNFERCCACGLRIPRPATIWPARSGAATRVDGYGPEVDGPHLPYRLFTRRPLLPGGRGRRAAPPLRCGDRQTPPGVRRARRLDLSRGLHPGRQLALQTGQLVSWLRWVDALTATLFAVPPRSRMTYSNKRGRIQMLGLVYPRRGQRGWATAQAEPALPAPRWRRSGPAVNARRVAHGRSPGGC
jgi:hypothetical protein